MWRLKNYLFFSVLNGAICVFGDELVKYNANSLIIRAICDNLTHALCGLLSAIIITLDENKRINWTERLSLIGFCAAISSFIDLDHFLAAKSIKLSARPFGIF